MCNVKKIISLLTIILSFFMFSNLTLAEENEVHWSSEISGESIFQYLSGKGLNTKSVRSVKIIDITKTTERYEVTIDISENQDGSVMAGIDGNTLVIQSNGSIVLNPNSSNLFYYDFFAMNIYTIEGLNNLDTSQVTNMSGMFRSCLAKRLDISNWDTSLVTDMSYMFAGTYNLEYLDLSNFDTSSVTNMFKMFINSDKIQVLNINNWDTSKVEDMSSMFEGATNLIGLNLSGWDVSSVKNMANMFKDTTNMIELNLNGWNASSVTDMSYMFYQDENLETLDTRNWNTSSLTNMQYMFSGCKKISELNLESFDTSNVTNMHMLFSGMWNLTKIDLNNWNTSNVLYMAGMFQYNYSLEELNLSGWDTSKVTNMSSMFWNDSKLKDLDLSNWNTSNVKTMYGMFYYTPSLENLSIGSFNTSSVIEFDNIFKSMSSNLNKLDLGNFVINKTLDKISILANEIITPKYIADGITIDINNAYGGYYDSNFNLYNELNYETPLQESLKLGFNYVFHSYDGLNDFERIIRIGEPIGELPTSCEDEHHSIVWYLNDQPITKDTITNIKSDVIDVYGQCEAEKFTITWKNEDGSVLKQDEVPYGENPIYTGETPIKDKTPYYIYSFVGWDKEITPVTKNTVYYARYTETIRLYNITWLNDDGTVYATLNNIIYEETLTDTPPSHTNPTKENTPKYSYNFAGWNKEIDTETGDIIYTATYNTEINKYTIVWKNYDGTIIETDLNVLYGTIPEYNGLTPVKVNSDGYRYEFSSWDKEINSVQGNEIYIACFKQIAINPDFSNTIGIINETDFIIKMIPIGTVKSLLLDSINNNELIVVYDQGNQNKDDEPLKTGDYIEYTDSNGEIVRIELSVGGDVNGDGDITPLDYVKIKNHIMETALITDNAQIAAADYNDDGQISPLDYVKVKNYIMNGN